MASRAADEGSGLGADFHYLNERFFSSSPHFYFEQRLVGLLAAAASISDVREHLAAGITGPGLSIRVSEEERMLTSLSEDQLHGFVTAESVVLLAHVSEVLLRHALVLSTRSRCPPLEIAHLRSVTAFHDQLKRGVLADEGGAVSRPLVESVFLGGEIGRHATARQFGREEWETAITNLVAFLRHFAQSLLDDDGLYNAAKHGMTLRPSQATILFADPEGAERFRHAGPSLEYLLPGRWTDGQRTWKFCVAWVNWFAAWFFIEVAVRMLENLWLLGRVRFAALGDVRPSPQELRLWVPVEPSPRSILQAFGGQLFVQRFTTEHLTETKGRKRRRSPPQG